MKIQTNYDDGKLTFFLNGELDHHGAKESLSLIDALLDDYLPRICILDMSGLSFMDSSGIAIILRVHKRMRETGGTTWVENPAKQALKVIEAASLDRIVKIRITTKES